MSQQVARCYQVGIGTADAAWSLLSDAAWAHETVLTTRAGNAEVTLWLLTVKAVEYCFDAQFLHAQQHFAHGRVWSLFNNFLLV
jgi:hypothetical protein